MKTFYTILFLLVSANLFAQDDSVIVIKEARIIPDYSSDSIKVIEETRTIPVVDFKDPHIIIIDGVVTSNPINDSIEYDIDDLLKEIIVYTGEFSVVYGTPICILPMVTPSYNWYISHSAGLAPEESEGTFYVSISTRVGHGLFLGLRGGIYTFQSPLDSAVNDTIRSYGPYSASYYSYRGEFVTQGPSYIGALFGSYHITNNFSLSGSAGVRVYSEDTWEGLLGFYVTNYTTNYSFGPVDPRNSLRIISSENVIKPYFSIGADYKTGKFLIGVFGDNVFSFGANIGIGFN